MKYRIKIITYKSGRTTYTAQVKTFIGWLGIMSGGETSLTVFEKDSRERALSCIDNHFKGNIKKQTIEFEYITKES